MAEISPHQFEQAAARAEIEKFAEEVERHRERPELQGASGHEVVRQALRSTVTPIQSQKTDEDSLKTLPSYLADASPQARLEVENLVEVALRSGIGKANALAQKSNPLILDAFHDALAGKLYEEFRKRGMFSS